MMTQVGLPFDAKPEPASMAFWIRPVTVPADLSSLLRMVDHLSVGSAK
jgi:hypothetical protein